MFTAIKAIASTTKTTVDRIATKTEEKRNIKINPLDKWPSYIVVGFLITISDLSRAMTKKMNSMTRHLKKY